MATTYHQLGRLAQLQENYGAAEALYRRSLEIKERIGNRAGVAISYAALADLSETTGNPEQAVGYRTLTLAIRLKIGTASPGDVRKLAEPRRRLGRERFRAAALTSGIDDKSADNLMRLLDEYEHDEADDRPAE